jgi:hypothetical protein
LAVEQSFAGTVVAIGLEGGKLKNLHCVKSIARKRLVETVID